MEHTTTLCGQTAEFRYVKAGGTKSEPELLYDWWFTANQLVLAPSPLRLPTRDFLTEILRA
jgi:hypothetical protein